MTHKTKSIGVICALLGASNPWGVFLSGLFIGSLRGGSNIMQNRIGVPAAMAMIIQGLAVFFVVIGLGIRIVHSQNKRDKKQKGTVVNRI